MPRNRFHLNDEQWKLAWSAYREASELTGSGINAFLGSLNLPEEVAGEVCRLLSVPEISANMGRSSRIRCEQSSLDYWCIRAMRSRLEPMKKVAKMLRAHEPLILNGFAPKARSPMAQSRVSTTKSEWLPDDLTAFALTKLWKWPFIITWDDFRSQNLPIDSDGEAIFGYTTIVNIYERPEGLKISSFFIFAIVGTSLLSRAMRSTELRIDIVEFDSVALELLAEDSDRVIRLVARKPRLETEATLAEVDRYIRAIHTLSDEERIYFFEVELADASEFECILKITGERIGKHSVLKARSPVVANASAAALLHLEKTMGRVPHAYFSWNEGRPIHNLFRFIFLGEGDTAPLT